MGSVQREGCSSGKVAGLAAPQAQHQLCKAWAVLCSASTALPSGTFLLHNWCAMCVTC